MKNCLLKLKARLKDFNTQEVVDAAEVYKGRGLSEREASIRAIQDHIRALTNERVKMADHAIAEWRRIDPESEASAAAPVKPAEPVKKPAGQIDLFEPAAEYGEPEFVELKVEAKRKSYAAKPSTPGGQVDLFSVADEAPKGPQPIFATAISAVKKGVVRSGFAKIETAAHAAHVFAGIRKSPRERFQILVLDKEDRPIAYFDMFSGAISQTSVYPAVIATYVYSTPGAAKIWLAHNHPSGLALPSSADVSLTRFIAGLFDQKTSATGGYAFDAIGVELAGHVVIADTKFAEVETPAVPFSSNRALGAPIPAAVRRLEIPVMERQYVRRGKLEGSASNPHVARQLATKIGKDVQGLLLMDSQNAPVAFYPYPVKKAEKLRTGNPETGFGELQRAFAKSGALNAVYYSPTKIKPSEETWVRNIGNAIQSTGDSKLLDVIERDERLSWAEKGYGTSSHTVGSGTAPFFARKKAPPTAMEGGEPARMNKRTLGNLNAAEQKAMDAFLDSREDADLIVERLTRLKDTPWARAAIEGIFARQAMKEIIAGGTPAFQSAMDSRNVKSMRLALERFGEEGIWKYAAGHDLTQGMMGKADKPVNNISSSFINCDPSTGCATFCYAARGRQIFSVNVAKSEIVTMAVEADPVRAGKMAAEFYSRTPEFKENKALRLFDKGDGTMEWIPFIEALNARGVRVQVFSKNPEFLRAVPDENVRMLSIDSTNEALADANQDLPVAYVYSDEGQIPAVKRLFERGQIQVILPVKVGQRVLGSDEIKQLRQGVEGIKPYLCPIDIGIKKVGPNLGGDSRAAELNKGWNCTRCDVGGGVGCFHGNPTKAVMQSAEVRGVEPDPNQRIIDLRREINGYLGTPGTNLEGGSPGYGGEPQELLRKVESFLRQLQQEDGGRGQAGPGIRGGSPVQIGGARGALLGRIGRVIPIAAAPADRPGPWRAESDGDRGDRTHYAVRDNPALPGGVERRDFKSAKAAKEFVAANPPSFARYTADDSRASILLRELAKNQDLFRYPLSQSKDMAEIAAGIDPTIRVLNTDNRLDFTGAPSDYWTLEKDVPDGEGGTRVAKGRIRQYADGTTDLDVSGWGEGLGGSAVYAIAANHALSNGLRFKGDTSGLSDAGLRRRNENMLSAALKAGTTKHLLPHSRQLSGDAKLGVPGIQWENGNDSLNIRSLMEAVVGQTKSRVPEIDGMEYDFNARAFRGIKDGQFLGQKHFDELAVSPGARAAKAGSSTLERAVLLDSLLREGRGEGRSGVLGEVLRLSREQLDPAIKRVFYARGDEKSGGITPQDFFMALADAYGSTVASKLVTGRVIIPVRDQSELPSHVVSYIREGDKIFGLYDPVTNRTYAVLNNLDKGMVRGLVLHEVGTHYGFERMIGDRKYGEIMRQLRALADGGDKRVLEARDNATKEAAHPSQVPEETLAYLVHNYPEMSLVRQVIAAIKAFLFREFGIGGSKLTADDMVALTRAAVKHSAATAPIFNSRTEPSMARANRSIVALRLALRAYDWQDGTKERPWVSPQEFFEQVENEVIDADEGALSHGLADLVAEYRSALNEQYDEWGGRDDLGEFEDRLDAALRAEVGSAAPEFSRIQEGTPEFKEFFRRSTVIDEIGRPVPVYHGTRYTFDEFANSKDGWGFHFGTKTAANSRAFGNRIRSFKQYPAGANIMPVYIRLENPVQIKDLVDWSTRDVAGTLTDMGFFSAEQRQEIDDYLNNDAFTEAREAVIRLLKEAGYDGFKYLNRYEGLRRLGKDETRNVTVRELPRVKPDEEWTRFVAYDADGWPVGRGPTLRSAWEDAHRAALKRKTPLDFSYMVFDKEQIKSAIGNAGTFYPDSPNIMFARQRAAKQTDTQTTTAKAVARYADGRGGDVRTVELGVAELDKLQEPAVPPGMVRLYRGGVDGKWFSASRETAEFFFFESESSRARIVYVDVPREDASKYAEAAANSGEVLPDERAHIVPSDVRRGASKIAEVAGGGKMRVFLAESVAKFSFARQGLQAQGERLSAMTKALEKRVNRAYEKRSPDAEELDARLADLRAQEDSVAAALAESEDDGTAEKDGLDEPAGPEADLRYAYSQYLKGGGVFRSRETALSNMRDAIEFPEGIIGNMKSKKNLTDEQILDAAKDAYDAYMARRSRARPSMKAAAADLVGMHGWKTVDEAHDWLSDDRSHGDEFTADASRELHDTDRFQVESTAVQEFVEAVLERGRALERAANAPRFARAGGSEDVFYSELARTVEGAKQEKAPPAQWKAWIRNQKGVKKDEIFWSGVEEWLDAQPAGKNVTRDQVSEYLKRGGVKVEVKIRGEGKGVLTQQELAAATDRLSEEFQNWAEAEGFGDKDGDAQELRLKIIKDAESGAVSHDEMVRMVTYLDRFMFRWERTMNAADEPEYAALVRLDELGFSIEEVDSRGLAQSFVRESDGRRFRLGFDLLPPGVMDRVQEYNDAVNGIGGSGAEDLLFNSTDLKLSGGEHGKEREFVFVLPMESAARYTGSFWFPKEEALEDFLVEISANGFEGRDYGAGEDTAGRRRVVEFDDLDAGTLNSFRRIASKYRGRLEIDNEPSGPLFDGGHYPEENNFAHARAGSYIDEEGRRILILNEIQSDWGQQGRKHGFVDAKEVEAFKEEIEKYGRPWNETSWNNLREAGAPDEFLERYDEFLGNPSKAAAPFISARRFGIVDLKGKEVKDEKGKIVRFATMEDATREMDRRIAAGQREVVAEDLGFVEETSAWVAVVVKRMLRYAAENGFDGIAWTTGEQQVVRYESALRSRVDTIEWEKTPEGVHLIGYQTARNPAPSATRTREELEREYENNKRRYLESRRDFDVATDAVAASIPGGYRSMLGGEPMEIKDQKSIEDDGWVFTDGMAMLNYPMGYIISFPDGSYAVTAMHHSATFLNLADAERDLFINWSRDEFNTEIDRMIAGEYEAPWSGTVPPELANNYRTAADRVAFNLDRLSLSRNELGRARTRTANRRVVVDTRHAETDLSDAIGKVMADQIIESPDQKGEIAGENITISKIGMAKFYEGIVPKVFNEVMKKMGGVKTGTIKFPEVNGVTVYEKKSGAGWAVLDDGMPYSDHYTKEEAEAAAQRLRDTLNAGFPKEQPGFYFTDELRSSALKAMPLFAKQSPNLSKQGALGMNDTQPPPNPPNQGSLGVSGSGGASASWNGPERSKIDDLIYSLQNKHIDMKRVVENVRAAGRKIADRWNPYLQEELYHGRTAKATEDFINSELKPLLVDMAARKVTVESFEEYLHARHAEERNIQIAKVNPQMPDGGSGMDTAVARAYMDTLDEQSRKDFEALAKRVDAITAGTRRALVEYNLEAPATVQAWAGAYENYVPLQREAMDDGILGIGQGFSVRGPSSKRAVGSNRAVVDILANVAMQREKAIVRGEKNRVALALYGLAKLNPNQDFWETDTPPTRRAINPRTGLVETMTDPTYKGHDNVVVARNRNPATSDIQELTVIFNDRDPRALRMATAIKNLDSDQLGHVLGASAKITRYFASMNTQFNPVFGVINLTRDVQAAMLNLTDTPLAGKQGSIFTDTLAALRGIYGDLRDTRAGKAATSAWAGLWEEFQRVGGQTGYRDMFSNSEERADALRSEIQKVSEGKLKTLGRETFGWLSDYNTAMENAVRLAAYKAGKESGMSNEQAASLAKNLTVNFNRKGQIALQAGALYAFFNASAQGTARIAQTLTGPAGRKIITGGILLGAMQALALAAGGFDDEEPPQFVRERSLVIPIGGKRYLTIPMPLGFNILPNIGRISTEYALSGFRGGAKRLSSMAGVFADTLNPIGSAGVSLQTISPTAIDPLAALAENKDWTGKQIAKLDIDPLDATPGFTRAKDTATWWSKQISEALNLLTGGTKYNPGVLSPTPDQLDYLIGQVTGGLGREISKVAQTAESAVSGEELPTYKIPLVGRLYGSVEGQAPQASKFYENLRAINVHENEIKGRVKDKLAVSEYVKENPEARLYEAANRVQREVADLKRKKREAVEAGKSRDHIKLIEEQITARMRRFNETVEKMRAPE